MSNYNYHPKWSPNPVDQITVVDMYVNQRKPASNIASNFGVGKRTIISWLRRAGITIRAPNNVPMFSEQTVDRIVELYTVNKLPARKIVELLELGTSENPVLAALRQRGVAIRPAVWALAKGINWKKDFADYPNENDNDRAQRLGVKRKNVRESRLRLGIAPKCLRSNTRFDIDSVPLAIRSACYQRADFHCEICAAQLPIAEQPGHRAKAAHHIIPREHWLATGIHAYTLHSITNLCCICASCHKKVHTIIFQRLAQGSARTEEFFTTVLQQLRDQTTPSTIIVAHDEIQQHICNLYLAGYSMCAIARIVGLSDSAIQTRLISGGIASRGRTWRVRPDWLTDQILLEYRAKDISKAAGININTVCRWRKRAGLHVPKFPVRRHESLCAPVSGLFNKASSGTDINDRLVPAAAGANPCTDNTHTTAGYFATYMGNGDEIAMISQKAGETV